MCIVRRKPKHKPQAVAEQQEQSREQSDRENGLNGRATE